MDKSQAKFNMKRGAFFGGTVGLCMGIAIGSANLLGFSSRPYVQTVSRYMASSFVSVAAWLSIRGLMSRERFPSLLYQSGAAHANTPLEHLRLLNNAPASISLPRPMPIFVHSRCA
ncbi:uncharacterized protein BYT42DRAFT_396148 [Radiomyces spectabilis]|uniref:uncharacterized protein n=1 Tax=Radiomyces spectabilis TaxID=64574 RepID=UPI002220D9C4|nr:uncharacterized protein BYT42DRAFT_396148 [Radiomyces spectabilis]KAI8374236.1 hypothetical protein BYT42DRAFT_396148 [Radiomyces spectabilis]